MAYNNMSQKERLYLQDALQMENLCISKCSVYADQCGDQELKSLMFDLAQTKRDHANQLKRLLGQNQKQQYRQYQ